MKQPTLFDLVVGEELPSPPDQAARDFAIDPANDVVLEASAGTGKTRVLVDRYVRLLTAGVDPRHVLAITFTRKAAAEMRSRILAELQRASGTAPISRDRARQLRDRLGDIQISTIDAFCFGLLREFPLEADVDPGFDVADETEMARFATAALDRTMRIVRGALVEQEPLRLLLARIKWPVLREAVTGMLDRRHIALPAVGRFLAGQRTRPDTAAAAARAFVHAVRQIVEAPAVRGALLDDGPVAAAEFRWLHGDLIDLPALAERDPARVQQFRRRLERYFLTKAGKPRQRLGKPFTDAFATRAARQRHEHAVGAVSSQIHAALTALDGDVNVLLTRGLQQVLVVAADQYERLLHDHALLDFAGMLERAVQLLRRQEEFARSRMKLQTRYHHLLVDEFQDTSRLQWELISLLVDAWGEGEGATDAPTSIFVVGDRKQSIYRFRNAEVMLLDEAVAKIGLLRRGRQVRQAITASFRAVPELLAFVNALATEMQGAVDVEERFTYDDRDRFVVPPVAPGARRDGRPVLGLVAEPDMERCAQAVAAEIARLLSDETVRDRVGGARAMRADDVAILFRARTGHQFFERALDAFGVRSYVYKGLGFFDAPEVQDLQALLRYLAQPASSLRAAELLRSRFIRLSDRALALLAPDLAAALRPLDGDAGLDRLDAFDRTVLQRARLDVARWLELAAHVRPSELLERVMADSAYAFELRGPRAQQAAENVKKVRALIRRVENRGYATLPRLAAYFETLRAGDESNAIIEAAGAVHLMTIHSAKGLEFPVVFVVNLHIGGRGRPPGFSIIERSYDGDAEVAFHSTAGTALEDRREQEELRRLTYVAVTRARDRLYLASEVDAKGRLRRHARSLASLLPPGLADAFGQAAVSSASELTWTTAQGEFAWRICRPHPPGTRAAVRTNATITRTRSDGVGPLRVAGVLRVPATDPATGLGTPAPDDPSSGDPASSDRVVGTLVHRLLQRAADPSWPDESLAALAHRLLRPAEAIEVANPEGTIAAAVGLYRRMRGQPDLMRHLTAGECYYEVPFSLRVETATGPQFVRGVMDCVVVGPDGAVTVLEFKTGMPRAAHQRQAATYGAAARALFGAKADIKILYP